MGFFSYTCAKTNLPVLASTSWPEKYSRVVVLDDEGNKFSGSYDGYGNLITRDGAEIELDPYGDSILSGKTKLVLKKFYDGETFEDLGRSNTDPGQGHFHNEDAIELWYVRGGFSSYQEYLGAFRGLLAS
jgi:hypothetical protein